MAIYQDIDATYIPYENHFDVVVFKSIIGDIGSNDNLDAQREAFKQIHKALKPDGKLLFAEKMVASPLHLFFKKRFVNWGDRWRYCDTTRNARLYAGFFKCSTQNNWISRNLWKK